MTENPVASICSCITKDLRLLASGMGFHDPHLQLSMDTRTESFHVAVYCRKCGGFWNYKAENRAIDGGYEKIRMDVLTTPCLSFDAYQHIAERMTKMLALLGPMTVEEMRAALRTNGDTIAVRYGDELFATAASRLGFLDADTEMISLPPIHPLVTDDEHKQSDDR